MFHVNLNIERPSKESVASFKDLAVATVYEASGRLGQVNCNIKPIAKGMKICGPAITVECHPRDNLMLHKALQIASPGDVIVCVTGEHYEAGYWGDLMTVSAIARECGGLAIDGCVRDSEEIIESGFPVFSRGVCITGTVKNTLGRVNHPIVFGGTIVNPGDVILGDDDGMVVVERSKCDEIYAASQKREEMEIGKAEKLKTGVSSVEFNKLDKKFEALGLKEG